MQRLHGPACVHSKSGPRHKTTRGGRFIVGFCVTSDTRFFFLGVKHERTTTRAATQLFLNTSPRVPDAEETSVTLLRDEVRRSKVKLRKECRRFMFLFISHQSLLKKITLY